MIENLFVLIVVLQSFVLFYLILSAKCDKEFIIKIKRRNEIEETKLFVSESHHRHLIDKWQHQRTVKTPL